MANKKKAKGKRKPAKKKSGVTVIAKAGKRKGKAKKRSGFLKSPGESLKSAFLASGAIRAASGLAAFIAMKNNKGEELPKVKMVVPGLITGAAYAGAIPSEYLFAGAMATTDAVVDNTEFLKDIFDFKFLADMVKEKKGVTVRQIPQRIYDVPARAGIVNDMRYRQGATLDGIFDERNGGDYRR